MVKNRTTDSIFFRRVMALLLFSICLSALLTSAFFYLISRNIFLKQKSEELEVRADMVVWVVQQYQSGGLNFQQLQAAMNQVPLDPDSHLFVTNFSDDTLIYSANVDNDLLHSYYMPAFDSMEVKIQQGESISQTIKNDGGQLIIGIPVHSDFFDKNSDITGAVYLSQSMEQVNSARDSLYLTLSITVMIVAVVMLGISFIVTRHISRPMSDMCRVAEKMSQGDFNVRADETQPLELGDMAIALNQLSARLLHTISELVLERNRLQQILDGLSEGILAIDRNGRVTHYNPAMADFFGHPPELLEEREAFLQDSELWSDFDTAFKESCVVVRTFRWKSQTIRVDIAPILNDTSVCVGVVGLFRDITESERLEQTRREYVANVSHELRTPISAIRSLTETLMDGIITKPEDIHRYYEYLLSESIRLSRLVDDLLELSRLQSSNTAFAMRQYRVDELLEDAAERVFPIMKERSVELVIDVPEGCPDVYINEDRIEQILMILLDNASKFTDPDGRVTLRARWTSEIVQIDVQDNGCGISEEDALHVFERFYKADKSHSGGGTGLGLSICKEIISLMNQRIWVTSIEGEGATFSFTMARFDPNQNENQ